jgi:transposase-like protein
MADIDKPKMKYNPTAEGIGRPSLFTPARRKAILEDILHRIPYQLAAEANGICEETLYAWLRTGRKHLADGIDSDYARFSESIKKAELGRMREHLTKISDNVERWQADAWILERRWYKHFGANAQVNELNARLDKLEQGEKDARQLHNPESPQASESEKESEE